MNRNSRVLVIGGLGNMGRRYRSILDYLEVSNWFYDGPPPEEFISKLEETTHVIIATPTYTHVSIIRMIKKLTDGIPILCEKPITKDTKEFNRFNLDNVYMVNNYEYMKRPRSCGGKTSYNYYQSGGDGLSWDCIQLFKFDSNPVLSNESPIWKAKINGRTLSKDEVDHSYISMIKDFLNTRHECWDSKTFVELHTRVREHALQNSDRNTSSDN
jgi:hypothetical protein